MSQAQRGPRQSISPSWWSIRFPTRLRQSTARQTRGAVLTVLLIGGVMAAPPPVASRASGPPPMGQQPSIDAAGVTLHVANGQANASDSNPGTERLPLATIGRAAVLAANNNAKGVATDVAIHAGTYREAVAIRAQTTVPIVFRSAGDGTVIISGSDTWTGWQPWRPGVYRHNWPFRWGATPIPAQWPDIQEIARRREMVFVNGRLLTQVLSPAPMAEGTFYVDEQAQWIYIWPPSGTDMARATVEVGIRPSLFKASGANLTIRGLTFQHAATFLDGDAVEVSDGSRVLIEDTEYRWNNWGGLTIQASTNVIVRRSVANYNGGRGMGTWRNKNLLFEDNETSFNNWRGAWGGFLDWAMGGIKNMRAHGGIWRRHTSRGNQAYGMWFDWDNQDIRVEDSILCNNRHSGLFVEASQGPITVVGSTLCGNERAGVYGNGAEQVLLRSNVVVDNGAAQIELGGSKVRGGVDNWETKQARGLLDQHWTLCGNVVASRTPDAQRPGWGLSVPNWPWFLTTLHSSSNTWWNSKTSTIFHIADLQELDLAGWQHLTRQDANSIFVAPVLSGSDQGSLAPAGGSPGGTC
jgi:hypothetical protein